MSNTPRDIHAASGKARTCIVSLREINRLAAWCSNYEFEDVIASVDDVDLISPRRGRASQLREWLIPRFYWRPGLRQIGARMSPGIEETRLEKDYDVFAFICGKPSDLVYLSAVKGWKDRCKTKVCVIVELWKGMMPDYAFHLSLLKDFDHVVLNFTGCVDALQTMVGRPCHHVPLGVDVLRFTPYPNPPARVIDVFSMGRRSDSTHAALLEMARKQEIFYIHDTIPGLLVQPRDHREHRDMLGHYARRSRYFVSYPAKVGVEEETGGQSEVGARFFEGAASGAAMLGQAPKNAAFDRDFGWPDAVINAGSTAADLNDALAKFKKDPELLRALGRKNATTALREFDWVYRWKAILRLAGIEPTSRLIEREQRLRQIADAAPV